MSKVGKRLIVAADEALAIARGEADSATCHMHVPADSVAERKRRLAAVSAAIERGIADIGAGRVHDAGTVFDEVEAHYTRMARERQER